MVASLGFVLPVLEAAMQRLKPSTIHQCSVSLRQDICMDTHCDLIGQKHTIFVLRALLYISLYPIKIKVVYYSSLLC